MNKNVRRVFNVQRILSRVSLVLLITVVLSFTLLPSPAAYAATKGTGPGLGLAYGQLWSAGKGKLDLPNI